MEKNIDSIKTGDLILQSFGGFLSPIIRFVTLSDYHHSTVAIRLDPTYFPDLKIVRTGGELFVLEAKLDKSEKWVVDSLKDPNGFDKSFKVLILPLKDEFYTKEFEKHVINFIQSNCRYILTKNQEIKVKKIVTDKYQRIHTNKYQGVLCSERVAAFYYRCLHDKINMNYINFLIAPHHFVQKENMLNLIFKENYVFRDIQNNNDRYGMLIIILILVILILLFYIINVQNK